MLSTLWRTVAKACRELDAAGISYHLHTTVVDNSDQSYACLDAIEKPSSKTLVDVRSGHGNIGFGAAHNMVIKTLSSDFHIVLNPDVELAPDTILQALNFMQAHPECGLLAPAVFRPNGQ